MLKLKMVLLLAAFFASLTYPAYSRPIVAASIFSPAIDPPLTICSIPGSGFALSASPSTVTIGRSSSLAISTITVSSLQGFSGTLSFTNSTSATGLNVTLSKTSVTISQLVPGTTVLKITNSTVVAAGSYSVSVTAANATVSHLVTVTVIVPRAGYSLASAPVFITVVAGSMNFSTVTVTSLNGFTGQVNLTTPVPVPALGFSAVPNKSSVTLTSPGTAMFNVTVSTTSLTPLASYLVRPTGTSGTFSNSTVIVVSVIGPDFVVSAKPLIVTLGPTDSAFSTINVTRVLNFNGTVTLTALVVGFAPPMPTATLAKPTITLSSTVKSDTDLLTITTSSTPYNTYYVEVNATSGTIKHLAFLSITVSGLDIFPSKSAISVTAGGASNTTMITLQSVHGFSGNVTLSGFCIPSAEFIASVSPSSAILSSGSMATSTLTISATTNSVPGNYTVVVSGANTTGVFPAVSMVTNTTLITVTVYGPDFKLTTASSTVSFAAGTTTSAITVTSLLGFTGDVSFTSFVIPPTGLTVSCTTVPGSMGTSTCTYTSTTAGTYAVLITGTSGMRTHSLYIAVFVSDFTVSSTPSAVTFTSGTTGNSTITISALSGFSGTVVFSVPPTPSGISCSLTVTTTGPPLYPTSSLSCTGSPGSYTVTVSATSVMLVHTASVAFTVTSSTSPDFTLTASSPSAVSTGSSATSTISLAGLNGFTGTISLTDSPPAGLSCTITPTSITLPSSTTATLSCSSSTSGTYNVTVTATGGSVSHTQTVTVTVNSLPSGSSSQPYLLYGLIGLVIVAAIVGVAVYSRRKKKTIT